MRVFARVEYDGSSFCGWQVQPDVVTVQSEIEKALATVTRKKVSVVASGRTDAGVHGKAQGIHFAVSDEWDIYALDRAINSQLPPTIFVYELQQVSSDFHARFSATKRIYCYSLSTQKSPLLRERTVALRYSIDWKLFETALSQIIGTHSFSSFCAAHGYTTNHVCTVTEASLVWITPTHCEIRISANRFIYKMIRNIIGTLIDIGRGKIKQSMAEIILAQERSVAGATAPPEGLVLESVWYDEIA